jgi:agmatine deiminase
VHVNVVVVADGRRGAYAAAVKEFCREAEAGRPAVEVLSVDMDDCWLRDTGPVYTFCAPAGEGRGGSSVVAVSFDFNSWGGAAGGCYSDYERDRRVGGALARFGGLECARPPLVLEGGSISCDGRGTLLTTEECLLRGNRNAGATRESLEAALRDAVGATRVIWLPDGVAGDDDTNGHVDNMCVFVASGRVILHWAEAADDAEQHARSAAALAVLETSTDADGMRIRVHKVHAPTVAVVRSAEEAGGVEAGGDGGGGGGDWVVAKARSAGEKLAASYINLVFAGDAVLTPAFGVCAADDERAVAEIQAAVAGTRTASGLPRKVIGVPSREIMLAGGGVHCLTVSEPAAAGEDA